MTKCRHSFPPSQVATEIADGTLAHAHSSDALFAKVLANGLRGDYLAQIERRLLAGLSYMKTGRLLAEKLVAQDLSYYDAYLAIGAEHYLLGATVAAVRWLLRLGRAETNEDQGITKPKTHRQ